MQDPSQNASLPGAALTCLNGLTHGGAAQSLFIPGEDPETFYALLKDIFEEFQPGSLHSAAIATDAALARWFLWRRQRAHSDSESKLFAENPDSSSWSLADLHRLHLLDRYKTQAERAMRRAFVNVESLRRETNRELHWQAAYDLSKQRFALQEQRFQFLLEKHAAKAAATLAQQSIEEEFLRGGAPPQPESAIHQNITLRQTAGQVQLEIHPSNHAILQQLAKDPRTVVRDFVVIGRLPGDLSWVQAEAGRKYVEMKTNGTPKPDVLYHFQHDISPEAFELVAAEEEILPAPSVLRHESFPEVPSAA